jgi:RHS repeat-associated protein
LDLSGSIQGAGGVGGLLMLTDQSTINNAPSTHFASYDGNGNVRALVNAASGTVSAGYEYGPFGELIRKSGVMANANPFRFSTKYQDDESDQLYYGYRSYNPSTGRWLSRDPIGEAAGLNLYGMVDNSPVTSVDRDGQQIFPNYPPPILPPPPPSPGVGDQLNPGGLRGKTGQADYTQWFNERFPNSVEGARDLLRQRIKEWIRNNCAKRSATAPGAENGSEIQDVDIRPDMKRFGDAPQGPYERNVQIGFFEFRTDAAQIRWTGNYQFCFVTKMYVEEQTGADSAIGGLFLFNKRYVRMAEWPLQGCGTCTSSCDKYAH